MSDSHQEALLEYKVVETSTVSDDSLEQILNEWTQKGWDFQGFQFAMREASRRPAMAFAIFSRNTRASQQGD